MDNGSLINKLVVLIFSYLRVFLIKFKHKQFVCKKMPLFALSSRIVFVGKKSSIIFGEHTRLYNRAIVKSVNGEILLGERVSVNQDSMIVSMNKISVGNDTLIGPGVKIFDHDHGYGENVNREDYTWGDIIIGNNVWIGANTIILKNTHIGDNCVIAAESVIKGNIPENMLVGNKKEIFMKKI